MQSIDKRGKAFPSESVSFQIRMAAAVVPVRIRRSIVHIERESTTDSGGIVRTRPGNQEKHEGRWFALYNPFSCSS